ncbi:DinB family protein [Actinoplanes sp. NPDC024001]|uniref:DinB family protein n=1 Tax=Actinoplanes sp. NPDC024001 TaxID=3154598 RepID=UPI0033FF5CF1
MADFAGDDLSGSRFERVSLRDAQFRASDLRGTRFHAVWLHQVVMRGVELVDVDIHGEIADVTINGVEVSGYVEAELDRRHPDRARMRPTDVAGFREAWDILERLWAGTVERARALDPARLHDSVGGEWSFIETLRHLVFATDAWLRRAVLGDPAPWDLLGLPWDEMPDTPGIPRDRQARPELETVLALRRDRMAGVRRFLDGLTEETLAGHTEPVEGPGWPESRSYPVRECLQTVLGEEWEHRLYAERDLDALFRESGRLVHATRLIAAPAETVFELIATPAEQPRWDGNDNLAGAVTGRRVRAIGDVFAMTTTKGNIRENHIVEFAEGRRIAWRPAEPDRTPPGHLWRWELEPVGPARTRVTHTYDWSQLTDAQRIPRAQATTAERLRASLDRLADLAEHRPHAA